MKKLTLTRAEVAGSTEAAASLSEQKEIPQETETQKLPENIDKLIKFMEETGGSSSRLQ